MKLFLRFICILSLFSSCDNSINSEKEDTYESFFEFFKVDTISFSSERNLEFQDLDYGSKKMVFLDNLKESDPEILLLDFSGNILSSFKWNNLEFGDILAPLKIENDEFIYGFGSKKISIFDIKSGKDKSFTLPKFNVNVNPSDLINICFLKNGNNIIFSNFNSPNKFINGHKVFGSLSIFKSLDLESGKFNDLISFPISSIFRNGETFSKTSWNPYFFHVNNFFYVIYGIDPVIYVYDSKFSPEEVSTIPFELKEFVNNEKSNSVFLDVELFNGRILNFYKLSDLYLISYFSSVDKPSDLYKDKSTEELNLYFRNLIRNRETLFSMVDSSGTEVVQLNSEGIDPKSVFVRGNSAFALKEFDLNSEKNEFFLYKFSLK